jgi:hypothetical protein
VNTFHSVYPHLVLVIGTTTAAIAMLGGISAAGLIALGKWNEDACARVVQVGLSCATGNFSAIAFLAFTRWMLS